MIISTFVSFEALCPASDFFNWRAIWNNEKKH